MTWPDPRRAHRLQHQAPRRAHRCRRRAARRRHRQRSQAQSRARHSERRLACAARQYQRRASRRPRTPRPAWAKPWTGPLLRAAVRSAPWRSKRSADLPAWSRSSPGRWWTCAPRCDQGRAGRTEAGPPDAPAAGYRACCPGRPGLGVVARPAGAPIRRRAGPGALSWRPAGERASGVVCELRRHRVGADRLVSQGPPRPVQRGRQRLRPAGPGRRDHREGLDHPRARGAAAEGAATYPRICRTNLLDPPAGYVPIMRDWKPGRPMQISSTR